jgi:hypothetical protein
LTPAPRADRRTLIRRVTIDLTGLPPTPEEVEAFLKDRSANAWESVIGRLLGSPRYGERWGRHWLDVVRYADTSGYSNDFERPNAWRYRDYVIRSFNQDKPYDQFIREQIAGDEMDSANPDYRIATGFLRSGPWEHTGMAVEAVTRQMFLDDATHSVTATFLGLTLGCARCHDHKFDPIPTRDYYRMQAVFATTEFARPEVPFLPQENTADLESGLKRMAGVIGLTQKQLERFDEQVKQTVLKKHGVAKAEELPDGVLTKAIRNKEGIGPADFEELKLFQKHLQIYRESQDRYRPKAFSVSSGPLDGATDGGGNLKYPARKDYQAPDVYVLTGGNIQSPAEKVEPGVLSLLARYGEYSEARIPTAVEGRRLALANWIAHPENPLTARVMVNRIWQYHFGRGIAADANNFGKMGKKPTHPELLDWLANHFIESGWSVKAVHRAILLSSAYQRSGAHPDMTAVRVKDPDNTCLAYFPPRRMEAEVIRDVILAISGELSADAGGPGTFPQINQGVARQPRHAMGSLQPAYRPSLQKRQRNRRTIYSFQQRSLVDPMIEVLNGPSLDLSCERREASVVPTQAFTLFNSQFVHDMALAMAAKLDREFPTPEARIRRAFQLAFGRAPETGELDAALAHWWKMARQHIAKPALARGAPKPVVHMITSELTGEQFRFTQQEDPEPYEHNLHASEVSPEVRALADITLVLMNANELVYVY